MKRAPLVLPASTPQDVDADQVAPPPDVIRWEEVGGWGASKGSSDVCACGGHTPMSAMSHPTPGT